MTRAPDVQQAEDLPPQHALLAADAGGLAQDLRHRVVLTGEAADEHVEVGNVAALACREPVDHRGDVFIGVSGVAEAVDVAIGRVLRLRRGFPLVRPHDLEPGTATSLAVRRSRPADAFETEAETTY